MTAADFFARLRSAGAKYPAHTFDFSLNVRAMVEELSRPAHFFFNRANRGKGPVIPLTQLYIPRWCEDPNLVISFEKLREDQKLEVLYLYTVPIHEFRHHLDFLLTPFGASFYLMLANEYLIFQNFSPFLLQNQELVPKGMLKSLDTHLTMLKRAIPSAWNDAWTIFQRSVLHFGACMDHGGLDPKLNRVSAGIRGESGIINVFGLKLEPVIINDKALSFSLKSKPNWYMRASTILEGRAVLESLLWVMHTLEGYAGLRDVLASYIYTLYPADGDHQDYRFFLDLAASAMGDETIEESFHIKTLNNIKSVFSLIYAAAWFALHTPMRMEEEQVPYGNMFERFVYALWQMERAYSNGEQAPLDQFLLQIEQLPIAQQLEFLPVEVGIESTLEILEGTGKDVVTSIWHDEIRAHFQHIFSVLETALQRRRGLGYGTPLGIAPAGNALRYLSQDDKFLLEPYEPGQWVKEWFSFRNKSIFAPNTSSRVRKNLRELFGLGEIMIFCDCGFLVTAPVPKWQRQGYHTVMCNQCQRTHQVDLSDVHIIQLPDDFEA